MSLEKYYQELDEAERTQVAVGLANPYVRDLFSKHLAEITEGIAHIDLQGKSQEQVLADYTKLRMAKTAYEEIIQFMDYVAQERDIVATKLQRSQQTPEQEDQRNDLRASYFG